VQREVAPPSFDLTDESPVDARGVGKAFLAQAHGFAAFTNASAEFGGGVRDRDFGGGRHGVAKPIRPMALRPETLHPMPLRLMIGATARDR